MHVAINGWFWNQPYTGSGQYIRRLLHQLVKVAPDLQLTLILPPGVNQVDDVPENVSLLTTSGPGGDIGKVIFEQRTYPRMVAQVNADIAHVPYWGAPLSSPARLVTSVLDVIPVAIPEYSRGFKARLYTSLVSTSARGSAHIITLSEASKRDITEYLNIPPDDITVTYLAADPAFHPRLGSERDPAVREKYNLPDEFVLGIGGFDLRKQFDQLLLAYTYIVQAEGANYPLVLAGREPEWGTAMFPDLHKYADDLGISEHIQWIGAIDEADKPSLYRLARVFVCRCWKRWQVVRQPSPMKCPACRKSPEMARFWWSREAPQKWPGRSSRCWSRNRYARHSSTLASPARRTLAGAKRRSKRWMSTSV
jgi:glycosyltransferase involved in cell wall biosynthesis